MHPDTLQTAVRFIEREEGVETAAYLDAVGVPTICAGMTRYPNGTGVRLGDICKPAICRAYLEQMLERDYLPNLARIPGWAQLGPRRQAALFSFAWNLTYDGRFYGSEGFETISAVLRDGARDASRYSAMPEALALYVKADGRVLPGLVDRRRREGKLWMEESGMAKDGILVFKARQDTKLKKAPLDSSLLSASALKDIKAGARLEVARLEEIPADSHAWVDLAHGSGRWVIFQPHWDLEGKPKPATIPVNWADFAAPVSHYLTVGEVLQWDARRRPRPGSPEEVNILAMAREFDRLREAWGQPLGITSGYRPEPINRQVGGVANSQHVSGNALDLYPLDGRLDALYAWLLKRWSGGLGDGRNKGFLHLDRRNGGGFARDGGVRPSVVWNY